MHNIGTRASNTGEIVMRRKFTTLATVLALCFGAARVATAERIVLENPRLRAVLGDDARWRSLVDKTCGKDVCATGKQVAFASVDIGGKTHQATRAELFGDDRLTIAFADCDTRLSYAVDATGDWIAFRLDTVAGTRPERVTLIRLAVTIAEHHGVVLNAAWNDRYAVCLRGINLQSYTDQPSGGQKHDIEGYTKPVPKRDHTLLNIVTQDAPGPRLEGAGAALVAAPTSDLKPILGRLATAYGLPQNQAGGVASRDLPSARHSYWFLRFSEKDVDKVIDYCRKTGLRQVMMNSGSWCASVGHYKFKESSYPGGIESLKRTVARLHEHGILVGMHTFVSKIAKYDAYVTPVPSRGFVVDMSTALAADVTADAVAIRTTGDLSQWPGSPVCEQKVWEGHVTRHQEVIIDDEIVRYESIGPEGKWDTFLGCERGAWETRAAAHGAATDCRHYAVDGGINGYIIDQDSPLFEETTSRLARVFNECDFDMVYFDGAEDVDRRRFPYYSPNAQAVAMSKFKKRPLIHMSGQFTHGLWHSFTRTGTIDQYPRTYLAYQKAGGTLKKWPTCKDHIGRSIGRITANKANMTPSEFGWFGIGPKSDAYDYDYDGLQFDEIEYLMVKSLAHDAPISLQTSFKGLELHPLTPDILEIVRQYEELRLTRKTPAETLSRLAEQQRDFVKLPAGLQGGGGVGAPAEFIEVKALAQVAGTHDVRAFVGRRGDDAIATLWHYTGEPGELLLGTDEVAVYDVKGEAVETGKEAGGKTAVPADHRRILLHFPGLKPRAAAELLAGATLRMRNPD